MILILLCEFQAAIIRHGFQQLPDPLHRMFKRISHTENNTSGIKY